MPSVSSREARHDARTLLVSLRDAPHRLLFAAARAYGPQRALFSFMRKRFPNVVLGKTAVIFRYDDVLEVLGDEERFTNGPVYAAKFKAFGGAYVLGMDTADGHDAEAGVIRSSLGTAIARSAEDEALAMHAAIAPADAAKIREIVQRACDKRIAAARVSGELNVPEFARRVTAAMMADYFGVPGPDAETLIEWAHALFYGTFGNLDRNRSVQSAAVKSDAAFHAYLVDLIAARKLAIEAGERGPDDVLGRLIRLQTGGGPALDDDGIRRNLQHMCDASDQVAVLATHAVATILGDSASIRGVVERAAATGNDAIVTAATLEAARFRPMAPFLQRYCPQTTVIARGTPRQKTIRRGSNVFVITLSAMFDSRGFPAPGEFRFDRPPGPYLHFGHGMHQCMGAPINLILLPALVKSVMRLKGLRAASGIDYDGPVPHRFMVAFD